MNNILSFILIAMVCLKANAQVAIPPSGEMKVFTKVEQPAVFPGGDESFKAYLNRNINLKKITPYLHDTSQVVTVKFLVDEKGLVSNVSVKEPIDAPKEIKDEAVQLIRRGPKWQPAVQNGRNVMYQVVLPITFPAISN